MNNITGRLHDKIISYSDLKQVLPDRLNCLDPQERAKVDDIIRKGKPLLFLPTYLMETHMQDIKYQKAKYKIVLMGILKDGRKINVIIDNIEPYFEVRIKDGTKEELKAQIQDITDILARNELTEPTKKSLIKAKPFKYYQQHKSWFLRLYYQKTKNRQIAIDELRKNNYETATDDKNSYYRVVCRDYKTTFSSWALLENYELDDVSNLKGDTIRVDISNYNSVDLDLFAKVKIDMDAAQKETDPKKKAKKIDECNKRQTDESRRIRMLDRHPEYMKLFRDEFNNVYSGKSFAEMTKDSSSYALLDAECDYLYQTLLKDKTLSCCWDIETWSQSGELPQPENKDDNIFCLSMTFQWVNEKDPFLKLCLCDYPANAKQGYLTIVCGTEQNIIKAFSDIFARMRPEFIFGFNDSDYDWNWVIKRAAQKKGLLSYISKNFDSTVPYKTYSEDEIMKYSFKKERVKVEAEIFVDGYSLMMPGYIPVDVRTIFRRLYPTAEQSSLKWFLAKNKLGGKEDMPYEKLFAIYKEYRAFMNLHKEEMIDSDGKILKDLNTNQWSDEEVKSYETLKEQLGEINNYCVVDAQRCHDLMKIRCVIMDHREVSNLSFVSVYDAFYRANGMKVRNLTIAIGQQEPFCIRFSNISDGEATKDQYPGAYVFPPKKGLKISKLSMEERCKKAELTKNTSNRSCQEWLNTTSDELKKYYDIIEKYGAIVDDSMIAQIEKDINESLPKKLKEFLKEPIGRPITGLDFSSLYPSLIRAYNFSPDYCILANKEGTAKARELNKAGQKLTRVCFNFGKDETGKPVKRLAYFVWHNNKYDPYIHESNGDIKIDSKGKPEYDPEFQFGIYPYILNNLFDKRSVLKVQMKDHDKVKEEIEAMNEGDQTKNKLLYEETVFQRNYINSKQNALKVFMNTFYGEAGNQISPFFVLEVAGGITTYGQKNIMKAQAYVEGEGCGVYYGDSVAEYTPILVKINDEVKYCEIQDLTETVNATFEQYNNGKEIAILNNIKIWSDNGWTNVKHIIRHKTNKKMYRVMTNSSLIDVTEDHSLLDSHGKEIKPQESLGLSLLTKDLPKLDISIRLENTNQLRELLLISNFKTIYNQYEQIQLAKICYLLKSLDIDYKLKYVAPKRKHITITEGHTTETYYSNDSNESYIELIIDPKGPIRVNESQTKNNTNNKCTQIIELPRTTRFVYDIETENHHFSAGVGNLVVHNTDSLYISAPEKNFINMDKQFYSGKIEKNDYWYNMVESTMDLINIIRDGVNTMFINDNGTKFLSMAYEEVLYPVAFTAKKKYFGIAHEHIPNFKPKELFIRGLEVKKRGVSDLLRKIFTELMWLSCDPSNLYDLIELVRAKIDEIYSRKWNLSDFVQTGVYRTTKKNIKIQTLVERMRQRGIIVKPNERFGYVIVKKYPFAYDIRGRKTTLSIGDKLELVDIAEKENLEIDLDYYMQGSVNGQLARLITYHPMFHVEPFDYDDKTEVQAAEVKIYKNACKFVEDYCDRHYSKYNTFGKSLQKIYKTANKVIGGALKQNDDLACELLGANVSYDNFETWFVEYAWKQADKTIGNYGKEFVLSELNKISNLVRDKYDKIKLNYTAKVKKQNVDDQNTDEKEDDQNTDEIASYSEYKDSLDSEIKKEINDRRKEKIKDMQKSYYGSKKSISELRKNAYEETMSILRKRVRENYDAFMSLYKLYNDGIQNIIDIIKSKLKVDEELKKPTKQVCDFKLEDFDFEINDDLENNLANVATDYASNILQNDKMKNILNKLKTLYTDIMAARISYMRTENIVEYLKKRRDIDNKMVVRPDQDTIKKLIEDNIESNSDDIMNLKL